MIVSSEGIVLKQRKIAGNRRLIVLFSKEYGKITAGTNINERGKGKSALALRPFTYSDYDLFKSRDSYNINSASVKQSFYSIGEDIERFMTASALIDYIDSVLEEGEARPKLFALSIEALEAISEARGNYRNILYAFIVKSLKLQGVMPHLTECVNCGKTLESRPLFSVTAGGIICSDCANREKTGGVALIYKPSFDIVEVIDYFQKAPIKQFVKVSLKPEVEEELKVILNEYIRHYIGADVLGKLDLNI